MFEFIAWIKDLIAGAEHPEADVQSIRVMPFTEVRFKKSKLTPAAKDIFVREVSQIPNIYKGLSHVDMIGKHPVWDIKGPTALVIQALGRAFKVWTVMPMDTDNAALRKDMIESDELGRLPMNTGLVPRGVHVD